MRGMEFVGKISKMGDKLIIIIPKNYHNLSKKEHLESKEVFVSVTKV
jgi:hypothetical protein